MTIQLSAIFWGPHDMVADIPRHMTLVPGEIISTSTPFHSRSVDPGDTEEVEVTGLGRLTNNVVAGPVPRATALGFDERVPERCKEAYRAPKSTDKAV